MTAISDETLMAYLDNELSAEERTRVNAALAGDPALQARLQRQERVRAMLSAAFDPAAREAAPERLVDAAMRAPVSLRWRLRGALGGFFGARELAPRLAWTTAALALGLAVGWFLASRGAGGLGDGVLVAEGALASALDQQLASDDVRSGPRVGVSFRARDGRLCRTFDMGAPHDNHAGVACRGENAWAVTVLAPAEPRRGAYELAGAGMPALVRGALGEMIAGEPLDADGERRARDGGWR